MPTVYSYGLYSYDLYSMVDIVMAYIVMTERFIHSCLTFETALSYLCGLVAGLANLVSTALLLSGGGGGGGLSSSSWSTAPLSSCTCACCAF